MIIIIIHQEINGEVLTLDTNRAADAPARNSWSWLLGAVRFCLFLF